MSDEVITSKRNNRISRLRSLFTRKGRVKEGQAALEGIRAIDEALDAGARISEVFVIEESVASLSGGSDLIERLQGAGIDLVRVAPALTADISDTESPQGVTAVVEVEQATLDDVFEGRGTLVLALAGLQDPGNMGTIIRSAACLGARGVVTLPGTVDPYNPKVLRSTAGALFRLPLADATVEELVGEARSRGFQLVVSAVQEGITCWKFDWSTPTVLVIGNEARGVPDSVTRLADHAVTIPMSSPVDSLNAAMAATVLLYEALTSSASEGRQR